MECDYAELAQQAIQAVMAGDSEMCDLVDDLIRACLYASDRRGIGSDRVWEVTEKIQQLRESR